MTMPFHRSSQHGAALIEALVAMLIVAFGVLGFVGLQARTAVSNLEGYQRSQALVLLNDMAARINLNRAQAASYVMTGSELDATTAACPVVANATATLDLCEWHNLIKGAAETDGGTNVGAMQGARGCIQAMGGNEYLLALYWRGIQATGRTTVTCGAAPAYASDLLRGVSMRVQIGDLLTVP